MKFAAVMKRVSSQSSDTIWYHPMLCTIVLCTKSGRKVFIVDAHVRS